MSTDGLFASVTNIPIVGVAIGLMLTYLVVSLVASSVKEAVASVFQWRGTYLQHGLGALLSIGTNSKFDLGKVGDGVLSGLAGNIGHWFKAHFSRVDPTAAAGEAIKLAQAAIDAAKDAVAKAKVVTAAGAPADPAATAAVINARNAATNAAGALAEYKDKDTISNTSDLFAKIEDAARHAASAMTTDAVAAAEELAASAQAALAVFKVRVHPLIKGTPSGLPSYVPARDFATAMLDVLRDGSGNAGLAQIKRTVDALPEGDIKRILSTFITDAGNDIDKLRTRIETWFDDAMDRLSGLYKRFTQYFLLALGLAIAVLLNIDSVHLAVNMWNQPALRAQIVASAIATVPPATNATGAGGAAQPAVLAPQSVQAALDKVNTLPLPIGRAACSNFFGQPPSNLTNPPPTSPNCTPHLVYKHWGAWASWTIVGWIVTAFAISLGAPFWFGLLQNIMNLRAAGAPPARSDAKT
jgi:hypothetical protein